ncbi:hypothetical protein BJ508DRAFT_302130 [Ascobolus immersus RN42]|uniref:Uncharacterized protein n=1 Tax=Ascobolus immersus RN42 TaxID=1160509 RepID=A0A3N4IX60_ASCIM|nr:hypothetical protein BJ508DRAFT_302130 [Ascobolus immersus RN42]
MLLLSSFTSVLAALTLCLSVASAGDYEYFHVFFFPGDNYTESLSAFQNILGISRRFSHNIDSYKTIADFSNSELEYKGEPRNGTAIKRAQTGPEQPFWKLLESPGAEAACRVDPETGEYKQCIANSDKDRERRRKEKEEQDRQLDQIPFPSASSFVLCNLGPSASPYVILSPVLRVPVTLSRQSMFSGCSGKTIPLALEAARDSTGGSEPTSPCQRARYCRILSKFPRTSTK